MPGREKSRRTADQEAELKRRHEELMAQQEETDAAFEQADQTLAEVQQKTLDAKVALEEAEHASSALTEKVRSLESQIELMRVQLQTNQERVRDAPGTSCRSR